MKDIKKIFLTIFIASLLGFIAGGLFVKFIVSPEMNLREEVVSESDDSVTLPSLGRDQSPYLSYEERIVKAIEKASPSVVSIVVTEEVPIVRRYYYDPFEELREYFGEDFGFRVPQYEQEGTEEREVGGGTGFIVSDDGLILTNKHVVQNEDATYTVMTNDGRSYEAEVLARDPVQDIAILKIEAQNLPVISLGNSDELKIGQTVVAIGNVLGEFRNSVSVGVVSGLKRDVTASGPGVTEELRDIIQTDAAINQGNSGGPLLNIKGEVVGVNTAMAVGAENVGFAIPINKAKRDVEQVKSTGKISYPFLGIYYATVTPALAEEFDLPVDYGAWVGHNSAGEKSSQPIFPNSPADKAGIQQDDIILEFDGERITVDRTLAEIIFDYNAGDKVTLKVLREGREMTLTPTLTEYEE